MTKFLSKSKCDQLFALLEQKDASKDVAINAARTQLGLPARSICGRCGITWNCKKTDNCWTCQRRIHDNGPADSSYVRCEGCFHVVRTTTPTGTHMCGFCSNVYECFYRKGICDEKVPLGQSLQETHWYVGEVDRMEPNRQKYYYYPRVKGQSTRVRDSKHCRVHDDYDYNDGFVVKG